MVLGCSPSKVAIALITALVVTPSVTMPAERESWVRVETENFSLIGNAKQPRIVAIGANLERLRETISRTSEGLTLHSPLSTTIFVFKDSSAMAPYNLGEDGQPEQLAGYFVRTLDGNYMAVDADAETLPYAVMYHEYMHYVLENSIPAIPLWLNEGLAEFYSTFRIHDGAAELGRPIPEHLQWLASHTWMSLDRLFSIDTSSEDYREGERQGTFYAQSWALVHYLVLDPRRSDRMGRFLALLNNGTPSAEALEQALGTDLLTVENELQTHARSGARYLLRYAPEEGFGEPSTRVEPMDPMEVHFHLGDLLAHHVPIQHEAAEEHLRAALAMDDSYADAYVALSALRVEQQRLDEAAELTSKALAAEPDHVRALVLRGVIRLLQFSAAVNNEVDTPKTAEPILLQARGDFRRALETAPGHIDALIGLGETYLMERDDLNEGLSALARAVEARPARTDVLASLIILTAYSGNVAGAQTLLQRALRPRGDMEAISLAEASLIEVQSERVNELLIQNKPAEALALARETADVVTTPALRLPLVEWIAEFSAEQRGELLRREAIAAGAAGDKERAQELLRQAGEIYGHGETAENETDLFDEAVQLTNRGDYEAAVGLFEKLAKSTTRPDLRTLAAEHAAELRRVLAHNQNVEWFNQALAAFNDGDLEKAESIVLELLDHDPEDELRRNAEQLLRNSRRRMGEGGS